jgi:hypothetical protein
MTAPGSRRPTQGVVLMILAMLSIPLVDGLAKHLSASYSPLFLGWARYAVASAVVLPFAAALHGRRLFPAEQRASHVLRTVPPSSATSCSPRCWVPRPWPAPR